MAKIYLSSTYGDLKEYREAVYKTLRKMRHDVVAMEDYVATDERPLEKCLKDVAVCDIYVGVFAWRYGYVPDAGNPDKRSITELEYRQAEGLEKPCLVFLLDESVAWPRQWMDEVTGDGEQGQRVKALRAELGTEKLVSFFKSPEELAGLVGAAVHNLEAELRDEGAGAGNGGSSPAPGPRSGPEQPTERGAGSTRPVAAPEGGPRRSVYAVAGLLIGGAVNVALNLLSGGIQQKYFGEQFSTQAMWGLLIFAVVGSLVGLWLGGPVEVPRAGAGQAGAEGNGPPKTISRLKAIFSYAKLRGEGITLSDILLIGAKLDIDTRDHNDTSTHD